MSLITVDMRDRKQLYEQLIDNIKNLILAGDLTEDDKLPSVRTLAKELGINPNTIQKAYSELERSGVIMTMPGRGSIIVATQANLQGDRSEKLIERMKALAGEMRLAGMKEEEFCLAAREAWKMTGGEQHDPD